MLSRLPVAIVCRRNYTQYVVQGPLHRIGSCSLQLLAGDLAEGLMDEEEARQRGQAGAGAVVEEAHDHRVESGRCCKLRGA